MKTRFFKSPRWCWGLLAAGLLVLSGCEDARTDRVIIVDPDSVALSGHESVVLTAGRPDDATVAERERTDALLLPLQWRVINPDLGVILSSTGHQAVYVSHGRSGQNVVTVTDQAGREGLVSINQD